MIKKSIPEWRRGFWLFCTPWMVLNRRGEQRISAHQLAGGRVYCEPDDHEPGVVKHGGEHWVAFLVERQFRERNLMVRLTTHEQSLLRPESGPHVGRCGPLFCVSVTLFLFDVSANVAVRWTFWPPLHSLQSSQSGGETGLCLRECSFDDPADSPPI